MESRKNSKSGQVKDDEIFVDEFSKSSVEVVRTRFTRWQGKEYLDLRVWYISRPGEREKATHKGITLRLELVPKLLESLSKVEKILEEGI